MDAYQTHVTDQAGAGLIDLLTDYGVTPTPDALRGVMAAADVMLQAIEAGAADAADAMRQAIEDSPPAAQLQTAAKLQAVASGLILAVQSMAQGQDSGSDQAAT